MGLMMKIQFGFSAENVQNNLETTWGQMLWAHYLYLPAFDLRKVDGTVHGRADGRTAKNSLSSIHLQVQAKERQAFSEVWVLPGWMSSIVVLKTLYFLASKTRKSLEQPLANTVLASSFQLCGLGLTSTCSISMCLLWVLFFWRTLTLHIPKFSQTEEQVLCSCFLDSSVCS